jgi:chromosome segregation ATPase
MAEVRVVNQLRQAAAENVSRDEVLKVSFALHHRDIEAVVQELDRVMAERDSQASERESAQQALAELRLAHRALKEDYETDKRALEQSISDKIELQAQLDSLLHGAGQILTETKLFTLRNVDGGIAELAAGGWTARVAGIAKAAEPGQEPFSAVAMVVATKVTKKG